MTDVPNKDIETLYDAVASRYDRLVEDTAYIGPRWLGNNLPAGILDRPNARVLDLACANGINLEIIKQQYPHVRAVGVDVSSRMIKVARQRTLYDALYVHDLDDPMPSLDGPPFDLVIALGFIEFLSHPGRLLSGIQRLLAPQGEALLSFQHHIPGDELAPRITRSGPLKHRAYTAEEIEKMVTEAGMQVIATETATGYVSNTTFECPYLMVRCRHR